MKWLQIIISVINELGWTRVGHSAGRSRSGNEKRRNGALIFEKGIARAVLGYSAINNRIMSISSLTSFVRTIIQDYASMINDKKSLMNPMVKFKPKSTKYVSKIFMLHAIGDWKAKVG